MVKPENLPNLIHVNINILVFWLRELSPYLLVRLGEQRWLDENAGELIL